MPEESAPAGLRTSARIDLGALEDNYRAIEALVSPSTAVLCVIKAAAYGHGALEAARKLVSAGVSHFSVATIGEGRELREKGISKPIVVLSGVMPWEDVSSAVDCNLTPVVVNFEMLDRVAAFAATTPVKVHIKIDTGMGRMGFGARDMERLAERLARSPRVVVEGIMSHFASSDKRDEFGFGQVEAFRTAVEFLKTRGIGPEFIHMANSAAILCYPEAHFNMVRPGIMLYGSYPDASLRTKLALKPVMRWVSKVAFTRVFGAGSSLSYGRTFVTTEETKVAYVPIGYADGYPRSLSNRGSVLVKGTRCRVLGTVCMEWISVDVTHLPDVVPGQEVVLMGRDGSETITADEIGELTGTIPYEILCSVSRRVPRYYV
jgi:alanine racemase